MIVFDLSCAHGHRFEGWFGSSAEYDRQNAGGLLACPQCDSPDVSKAPMAPAVPAKSNQRREPAAQAVDKRPLAGGEIPPALVQAFQAVAKAQAAVLKDSTWVGDKFAEQSRAMHYGEQDAKLIHGQATPAEARELHEEGVGIAPILFPVAPPQDVN